MHRLASFSFKSLQVLNSFLKTLSFLATTIIFSYTQMHGHTYIHTYHAHKHTSTHTQTTHTHARIDTHTHTHTRKHTPTTHTHTHTHTHHTQVFCRECEKELKELTLKVQRKRKKC